MKATLIRQVWQRAAGRCEYCRLPANFFPLTFHADHITPRQHGGVTALDNLALACLHCNRHKGPNLAGLDPTDGELVKLFIHGVTYGAITLSGPEPIPDFRAVRESLQSEGRFPAD